MSTQAMTPQRSMREDVSSQNQHLRASDIPIEAEVSYLVRDSKYQHEKPYRLEYELTEGIARSNVQNETKSVLVHSFRPIQTSQSFEEYGFTCVKLPSMLRSTDFEDEIKVREAFYAEAVKTLKLVFPHSAKIEILEHQIRKRHQTFPIATGQAYEHLLPATLVHIDFTANSAIKISHAAYKDNSERSSRLITVNIWKSLQGPGNDWPLALCDRRTVDHTSDVIGQDLVFHDRYTENARLYYHPRHRWYYFDNLGADEAIVFLQTDSDVEGGGGVPHTAFYNSRADKDAKPRMSVELRAFVYSD